MRRSGGGGGLAAYGCLEEMAMMTPGRSVLGRRDREREDPQMGRGLARWRDRRPGRLWRHMRGRRGDRAQIGKGLSDG